MRLRHPKEVKLDFSVKQLVPNILTEESKSFLKTLMQMYKESFDEHGLKQHNVEVLNQGEIKSSAHCVEKQQDQGLGALHSPGHIQTTRRKNGFRFPAQRTFAPLH